MQAFIFNNVFTQIFRGFFYRTRQSLDNRSVCVAFQGIHLSGGRHRIINGFISIFAPSLKAVAKYSPAITFSVEGGIKKINSPKFCYPTLWSRCPASSFSNAILNPNRSSTTLPIPTFSSPHFSCQNFLNSLNIYSASGMQNPAHSFCQQENLRRCRIILNITKCQRAT